MRTTDLRGTDCIGYIRVSTEAQAGEKQTSLVDQRAAIRQLAARLGANLGHVFEDAGVSGVTMEYRPGLQALIDSCDAYARPAKQPGYVLVLNDSRWGRFEQSEEAAYWRVHLEKRGWRVRFAEHDDVQDDTVRPVLRAIAQSQSSLYRKTLKANVLRGTRGQAEQGYWQAQAPFGYARKVVYPPSRERTLANDTPKATDEKVILAPIPAEASIVRAIFERYTQGTESVNSLLEWLSGTWPTKPWTRATVLRMLKNPAYVGDVTWGRVHVEPGRRTSRSDGEWYGKRDAHEAIIARPLFAAAQARLTRNKRRTRGVRSDYILSGVVRCRCGRPMVGNGISASGPVYVCSTRGAHASARCAFPGAVTQRLIETAVLRVLAEEIGSPAHRRLMGEALDRAWNAKRAAVRPNEDIGRDIATLQQRQRRLVEALEMETLTREEVGDRLAVLRRDLARLHEERDFVGMSGSVARRERDKWVALALDFPKMAQTLHGPALRELVAAWIKRAEFDTTTRGLTMEIRRIPSAATVPTDFGAEGEGSEPKSDELTVVRQVEVRGAA